MKQLYRIAAGVAVVLAWLCGASTIGAVQALPSGVVQVILPTGESGTGVLVADVGPHPSAVGWRIGRIATAAHVVERTRSDVTVVYSVGGRSTSSVVERIDHHNDIAVIRVTYPALQTVHPIADRLPQRGDLLTAIGQRSGLRQMPLSMIEDGRIYADGFSAAGDSGGPIFDRDGRLVGIVSGGWFWLRRIDGQLTTRTATWPTRAGGFESLLRLLAELQ